VLSAAWRSVRTVGVAAALAAALAALAGCGSSASMTAAGPTSPNARTTASATLAADPGAKHRTHPVRFVHVSRTAYGPALVDRRGFALYLFTHDRSPASTCYGACANAWPPYVVAQRPRAVGSGARAALIGSTRRRDGTLQVTYRGHPLYHYVGDRRPRQVLCQAVAEYGGTWLVVAPDGHAIGGN
jgi:predicted lipoprotein with Yx(FWY)xxD motif